jgi:hypothetical protein
MVDTLLVKLTQCYDYTHLVVYVLIWLELTQWLTL